MIKNRPVVTLCGSYKGIEYFQRVYMELSKLGYIVLMPAFNCYNNGMYKEELIKLHFDKISISDAIVVIAPNMYLGNDAKKEMDYAVDLNIPIYVLADCGTIDIDATLNKMHDKLSKL